MPIVRPLTFADIIIHVSSELVAFVVATFVTSSLAAPTENSTIVGHRKPNIPAGTLNCNDPKTGTSPECWNELKVDDYLNSWHELNPPASCRKFPYWTSCFNPFSRQRNGPQDCIRINSKQCLRLDIAGHYLSPQWFYGSYNSWSINQFFSGWYNATKRIAAEHPEIIYNAAKPVDFDEFLAANNNNTVSIDLALSNLITLGPKDPQNDALRGVLKSFNANITYYSNNVERASPPVATLLQVRLEQVLKHVQSDLPSFLAMASNGTFTKPMYSEGFNKPKGVSSDDLICAWWPESCQISLDTEPAEPFNG
ncbi:MAG: hypothetical protein Q9178_006909 [Gyalolechia marmorata]